MSVTCIRDLAELIGGRSRLGSLPPLGGELEPIGRVVVDCNEVTEGDVFWALNDESARLAEQAFIRGAAGVVVCGRTVEPWAGKFSIEVSDAMAALRKFASWKAAVVQFEKSTLKVQPFVSELREFDTTHPPG